MLSYMKEGVYFSLLILIWAVIFSSPFVTMMFAAEVADIVEQSCNSPIGGVVAFLLCGWSYITALLALSTKVDW